MAALPYPELIAFIDESGDFGMQSIDDENFVCSQCALTLSVADYITYNLTNLTRLKYKFFGTEATVLHGHRIRKKSGEFSILSDQETHKQFMDDVVECFANMAGCLIIAAVDKKRHKAQYINPYDPFFLSLQFVLERLHDHWAHRLSANNKLLCVFEARGKKEDKITLEMFSRICAGENYRGKALYLRAEFRSKDDNIAGHQYADLAAYTACRYAETRDEQRKDWKAIKGKLRTKDNTFIGHGLKIFPY